MWYKLAKFIVSISPRSRRWFWKWWYQIFVSVYKRGDLVFMNYGYVDDTMKVILKSEDERDRYPIQLYHHLAIAVDLSDKDVLEVGSGQGGGASYITRYFQPRSMIGIDISSNAVDLCNKIYQLEGLSFQEGDAETLPFMDEQFDVVLNVESSHCYGNITAFLEEVYRVLKSGGYLLFCDVRETSVSQQLIDTLRASRFLIIRECNITDQVLKALDRMSDVRTTAIDQVAPKIIRNAFHSFAGVKGGAVYDSFLQGNRQYFSCVLQKPV